MIVRKAIFLLASVFASAALLAAGRSDYLDLMEAAVDAYTPERRAAYVERVERDGITEHGFARLVSNIGILVANGRKDGLRGEFVRMMDLCAREQPIAEKRNGATRGGHLAVGSEFAVKELVFAVAEAEKSGLFPKEKTDAWRTAFTPMLAPEIYSKKPEIGDAKAHNWTIFGTASEQARIQAGMGGDPAWVEKYVADQMRFFDANGMFRDPGCPMMYDFVTRLQYAVVLSLGYAGPSRARLEQIMDVSAEPTIYMQSVTGEMPFGGRSIQFLHNETVYAALCEWYASRYARRGDAKLASRFRAAAGRAVQSVRRSLEERPVRHVKNRYPSDTRYGCEEYAYFDKYMITMGSWAYLAFRFADESIPAFAADEPDSTFVTGPDFHRVMMNAGGYTLEFDLAGQLGYDATGLGRIQKRGAPGPLALAVPFPVESNYRMDVTNAVPLAIGPLGVARLEVESAGPGETTLRYQGGIWRTKAADDGIDMVVEQSGEIVFAIPAFEFDGETRPRIDCNGNALAVSYRGWTCRYETDGTLTDTGRIFGNRNGHYRLFEARAKDRLRVHVAMGAVAAPKLIVVGDSLTADRPTNAVAASWARALEQYMKPGCTLDNYAKSGASTKSFLVSGRWSKAVKAVKPGDYVLIQFGGNDQKWCTPFYLEKRFADHKTTFRDIIRRFVKEVRAKGGKPVLVSESVRGTFDENGKLFDEVDAKGISLACYATAMREMSEELKTEFVDMNKLTHDLLVKLGKEESLKFYVISSGKIDPKTGKPSTDTTHTVKVGAEAYARLFLEDVKKRNLAIAEIFN